MNTGNFKVLYCNRDLVVSHLAEAIVMSGLPMSVDVPENLAEVINATDMQLSIEWPITAMKRAKHLGSVDSGTGHDCFLKGVVVTAIVSAPAYWWPQFQRYHFADIISSQSKMHRITKMDLEKQCTAEVEPSILVFLNNIITAYNNESDPVQKHKLFRKIVANTPHGLTLTAGIVTNYLQLKTMELQREHHKMEEWSEDVMAWIHSLPYYKELTTKKVKEHE